MPQQVIRNPAAEERLFQLLWADQMKDVAPGAIPLPQSPNRGLEVPSIGGTPETAQSLARLLATLRPNARQVRSITGVMPAVGRAAMSSLGIDPKRLAGGNDLKGQVFVDPQRSGQDQYHTFLHELAHSAYGPNSEGRVQYLEQQVGIGRPKGQTGTAMPMRLPR